MCVSSISVLSESTDEYFHKGSSAFKQAEFKQSIKFFTISANQGNPTSQYNLAAMYDEGIGVSQDQEQALK